MYDFIFAGAGASALSILYRMIENPFFNNKKILLIDQDLKNQNDRTWSIWHKGDFIFEEIVYKSWENMSFLHKDFSKSFDLKPYRYLMLRGKDFYDFVKKKIKSYNQENKNSGGNIEWIVAKINDVKSNTSGAEIYTNKQIYQAQWIFNSIAPSKTHKLQYHYYLQHFLGWTIKTEKPVFDVNNATFMDFRVEQTQGEAKFVYVLPFSENEALIEYTIFGKKVLEKNIYEQEIQNYILKFLNISDFEILEKEFGVIPMYDEPFAQKSSAFVINIGTAGGCSKASTGYTFQNIQKQADEIIKKIINGNLPFFQKNILKNRFSMYDATLLEVFEMQSLLPADIFKTMFEKHSVQKILRFLDEDSNFLEEIQIMNSMPYLPFLEAVKNNFVKKIKSLVNFI